MKECSLAMITYERMITFPQLSFCIPIYCGIIPITTQYIENMICPSCGHADTKVIDSRADDDDIAVRRRRECLKCSFRYSTIEQMEILDLGVVKNDGSVMQYDRQKVLAGIQKACERRPISKEDLRCVIIKIETDIQKKARFGQVKSSHIGSIVLRRLKCLDPVAYIRFASVYRNFENVATFQRELEKIT